MEFEDVLGSQKCMIFWCFLAKSWPDHLSLVDLCFGNVPDDIWVPLDIAIVCKNVFWPRFGQKTPNSNIGNCFYRHACSRYVEDVFDVVLWAEKRIMNVRYILQNIFKKNLTPPLTPLRGGGVNIFNATLTRFCAIWQKRMVQFASRQSLSGRIPSYPAEYPTPSSWIPPYPTG